MEKQESFLWGCIGGIAPEVRRWFKIVSTGAQIPHLDWMLYAVFLSLYVLSLLERSR